MSHMLRLNRVGTVISQLKSNALNTFSTGIQQSQFSKACEQTKSKCNRFHKGEPVTNLPQLSHFKIYGLGIYLFFSFIKHLAILFGILTLLSMVPMVVNVVYGSNYKHSYNSLNIMLTKTSLGSHKYSLLADGQQSHRISSLCKIVNVTFDVIACLLFLVFCMYWQERSKTICKKIQHQTKLQSSFTVEVTEFPKDANECDLQQFMVQFGRVTEVVAVRDKTQIIDTAKDINQSQLQIKQLQAQIAQEEDHAKYERIQQLQKQICEQYEKLQMSQTKIKRINKFYVQYETMQQRDRVVRKFAKYQKFYHPLLYAYFKSYFNKPSSLLLHNECVWVQACQTQPTSIIWQTSHITWRKRMIFTLLQVISTFFVVNGSLVLVSYLSVLVPATESNLSASEYSYDQISAMYAQDPTSKIVQAWCIQNYQITGSFSQYASTCTKFWNLLTTQTIVGFLISILVMGLKRVIQSITNSLSQYQKYPTLSQKSITNMTKLYQMQFLSSNIMSFLAQANLFGLSVIFLIKNIIPLPTSNAQRSQKQQQQYSDLSSNWYKDVGFQLWLNILILCFLPHVYMPIQYYIGEKLSEWRARKEKLYKKAVLKLQPFEFEIQTESANILLIVSTGFVFGGGIQAMMCVVLACLLVRYFYLRYVFIRFCRVPPIYNESLNSRSITILKLVLVLRCFMSLYMYTAEDVFVPGQENKLVGWVQSMGVDVHAPKNAVLAKLLMTWYYSIFAVFIFMALCFHSLVVQLISKRRQNKKIESDENKNQQQMMVQPQSAIAINNPMATNANANDNMNGNNKNDQVQTHHQIFSFSQSSSGEQTKQQRIAIKSYRFQDNPMYAEVQQIMKSGTTKITGTKTNMRSVSVQQIKSNQEGASANVNVNVNMNAMANKAFTRIKGKLVSQIKDKVVGKMPTIAINQFFA